MDHDFGLVPQIADTPLDLSKDEKMRAMALMLAISFHKDTVIKDAGMYQQMKLEGRNMELLTDATVVATALRYETYIRCGENPERMALIETIADQVDKAIGEIEEEDGAE